MSSFSENTEDFEIWVHLSAKDFEISALFNIKDFEITEFVSNFATEIIICQQRL